MTPIEVRSERDGEKVNLKEKKKTMKISTRVVTQLTTSKSNSILLAK